MNRWISLASPDQVQVHGILGDYADRSACSRLREWIVDETSPALALFLDPLRASQLEGDWYGEHVGKWMIAASRAARRRSDDLLAQRVRFVAQTLMAQQELDGRISSYPPESSARYDHPDCADRRTWDLWVQSYVMLGLLEAHDLHPDLGCLEAAERQATGIANWFHKERTQVRSLGNHRGLSATVLLEPVCLVGRKTQSPVLRQFADAIVDELRPDLVDAMLGGAPVSTVATGKIYQILWNLVGLCSYGEWTGEEFAVKVARQAFDRIQASHLTPAGGPWGGVAGHKEVFNPDTFFSPYGMVETCSTWAWMQLCRELYRATGDSTYLDHFERSTLNQLLGAAYEDGRSWSYFSFPNGPKSAAYDWACCKSSGAAALEEVGLLSYHEVDGVVKVALLGDSAFQGTWCSIRQTGSFPVRPQARLTVEASREGKILVRWPSWSETLTVEVDSEPVAVQPNVGWVAVQVPQGPCSVTVTCSPKVTIVPQSAILEHHGHEIHRLDYFAVLYGPWAMAAGLAEGFARERSVRLPRLNGSAYFRPSHDEGELPKLTWLRPDGPSVEFGPYFQAGALSSGNWRALWQQVVWQ